MHKKKIYLVIQNAWDTDFLTMPLALGYIKAFAESDENIAAECDIRIFNYQRRASVSRMALELFEDPPDILGFSVLGWNYQNFGQLAETYRNVKPDGLCVFGGTHASYQAERVFRMFPWVDVIVNGEGEITFRELIRSRLAGRRLADMVDIEGVSINLGRDQIVTTADRPRIKDLDILPSPFLTGAIPMFGPDGKFLYDVALMETNRGCPYQCSFCYWGGAVGQKIYSFSRERLKAELEFFAQNKVENICLCDANFGILRSDIEFVEDLFELRERYGYPRNLVSSWAKNKSKTFYEIVKRLKDEGFHSDFTLSLQTLNPDAIELMNRKNMKLNDFQDLCEWLDKENMSAHVELIWGVPGETAESFVEGYDRLAEHISRIATYPLCVLPNTTYAKNRQEYDMVTVRDTASDYEFVLSHSTLSMKDNRRMHHFLFWSRVIAEYQVFRHIWRPLRVLAGVRQSEVMHSLDDFFATRTDPASDGLRRHLKEVVDNFDITRVPSAAIYTYIHADSLEDVFRTWWRDHMLPRVPEELRAFFDELFTYDWVTRPVYDAAPVSLPEVEKHGGSYYVRVAQFDYDVRKCVDELKHTGKMSDLHGMNGAPLTLYFKKDFYHVADSHEFVLRYVGKTEAELAEEADLRRRGRLAETVQPHVVGITSGGAQDDMQRRLPVV